LARQDERLLPGLQQAKTGQKPAWLLNLRRTTI
jgi:hypothetical protein